MKRAVSYILTLLTFLLLLTACSSSVNEKEAVEAAKTLLPRAAIVNNILFSEEGVPAKKDGKTDGKYAETDTEALKALGFSSMDAVKSEASFVFDEATYLDMMDMVFENPEQYGGYVRRYITHKELGEMRYIGERSYLSDKILIDESSISFVKSEKLGAVLTCTVSASGSVTDIKGNTRAFQNESFRMSYMDGEWRIADFLFMKYTA